MEERRPDDGDKHRDSPVQSRNQYRDKEDSSGMKPKRDRDDEEEYAVKNSHRHRDGKKRTRNKRRKHQSSASDLSISASPATSYADFSSSDESSDGDRRRKDRKRRKEKKRSHRRSEMDKSKEGESKDKRRKSRRQRDKYRDEDDSEREKKRRLLKDAKKFLRRHKQQEEINSSEIQASGRKVEKISADDYFLKSTEFATWLKEDRGVYFSDLSSEVTHKTFETFVDKWNGGRLHPKYYDGIKEAPRTNHNWAIKTEPEDLLIVAEEEQYALAKKDRYERKRFQKEHEIILDEICPKATGHERKMEKKAIRWEQARAREDSPEMMKERDVMGGGADFQQRLAREKARKEKKQSEKLAVYNEKLTAFEEKEIAAMDQLRALVNVAGGKITIAKRQS